MSSGRPWSGANVTPAGPRASAHSRAGGSARRSRVIQWRRTASATGREPALAQGQRVLDVRPLDGLAGRARALEDHGQAVEAGLRQERGDAVRADLALAEVDVPVAVGAELGHRVVDVQGAEPIQPHDGVELVEDL